MFIFLLFNMSNNKDEIIKNFNMILDSNKNQCELYDYVYGLYIEVAAKTSTELLTFKHLLNLANFDKDYMNRIFSACVIGYDIDFLTYLLDTYDIDIDQETMTNCINNNRIDVLKLLTDYNYCFELYTDDIFLACCLCEQPKQMLTYFINLGLVLEEKHFEYGFRKVPFNKDIFEIFIENGVDPEKIAQTLWEFTKFQIPGIIFISKYVDVLQSISNYYNLNSQNTE